MANWALPTLSDSYTNFLTYLDARLDDAAIQFRSGTVTPTNIPIDTVRWNSTSFKWEKATTTAGAWADLATSNTYGITATAANTLATARTIALSSDVTGSVSFNGSANVTITSTLANSGVTAGSYGSGTVIPILTIDAKGRVTTATSSAALGTMATQNSNNVTITGGSISGLTSFTLTSGTGSATEGVMQWHTTNDQLLIGRGASVATFSPIDGTATLTNKTLTTPVLSGTASGIVSGRLGYSGGALSYGNGTVQRIVVNTDEAQSLTNKTITLAADGTAALHAVTKQQLDTGLGTKENTLGFTPVNKAGDTLSGTLNFGSANATFNTYGTCYLGQGNFDGVSDTQANIKLYSWFGIGFAPSSSGNTITQYENAVYINVRTGDLTARGSIYGSTIIPRTTTGNLMNTVATTLNIGGAATTLNIGSTGGTIHLLRGTGAIGLPTGTDAQRPGTPAAGYMRYNTTSGAAELYNGAAWAAVGGGGFNRVIYTSGSGTYTKPAGIKYIKVIVVGGGGGAASITGNTDGKIAPSGASGGVAIKWIPEASLSNTTYVVGAGGTGGAALSSQQSGGAGGTTTFGAHCSATGGGGGTTSLDVTDGPSAPSVTVLAGPQGGTATGGDINVNGSSPELPVRMLYTDGVGTTYTTYTSKGADSLLGTAGPRRSTVGNGNSGTGYGAGGTVGYETGTTDRAGGAGSQGIIIIEEFY